MPRVQTLKCGSKRFNIINYCASSGTATQCETSKERVKGAITEVSDSGEGQTKTLSAVAGGWGRCELHCVITDFHVAFLYPLSIRLEGLYNFLQGKMYNMLQAERGVIDPTTYIYKYIISGLHKLYIYS